MKAVGHKAIISLLRLGTPFPKNTRFLSEFSCLCRVKGFTSLWGQCQGKELPAGPNALVMFFQNHYRLPGYESCSRLDFSISANRHVQADWPLALFFQALFSGPVISKAILSRNISWMVLENTHIIFLGSPPEVGASCIAGNVEYSNPLETGQRDWPPIALHRNEGNTTLSPAGERPFCQSTCSVNRKQPAPS